MSNASHDKLRIQSTLNSDLEVLKSWSELWQISFNPSKTEVLYISANNKDVNIELKFGDTILQNIREHKHLGITLMSNGKWSAHIDNVCKSAYKQINVLRKLKYLLNRSTLSKIYKTFILPVLEYSC